MSRNLTYWCDCKRDSRPTNSTSRLQLTEVDNEGICQHCGYYAQVKINKKTNIRVIDTATSSPIGEDYHSHLDLESLEFSDT